MSKLLQLRGGTTSEHSTFTGALREVTVDTDKDTLVVHDGSTAGGHALPRTAAEVVALISNDAIDSQHYAAGSIDLEHMSANSVDSDQYVDGSIDLVHMSANSVDSDQYVDGSIDLVHMSANSVDSDQYVDGSIDLVHMSAESVDEDNLHISNVGTNGQYLQKQSGNAGGLTWGTVDLTTLSGANLTSGIIPTARINASSIANDLLDSQHYAAGSIDTEHLAADSVTTAKIADSVALGGSPTTTTQSAADNSTKVATTAYADAAVAALADSAPSTLNTLNELAAALGDDANYATTTTTLIGTKLSLAGGALTGPVTTTSTIDGRDVAADGVLATNALPKAGGTMTGGLVSSSDITVGDAYISSAYSQFTGLRVPNNGYIGTPTTVNALQIQTNGNIALSGSIQASGNISTSAAGVTKWYQPSNSGNPEFYLGASDTERFGIQTVYDGGTQNLSTVSFFTQTASGASNKADMKFSCDGTLRLTLNDAGATVAGDILASGNVTAYSDERLKSSVETIPDALSKVLNVRGVTFDMNAERGTGVIAQELEKVLPEAVFDNEDGMKSVAYGNVVGLLIEAIKEQQTQIETLMDIVGE